MLYVITCGVFEWVTVSSVEFASYCALLHCGEVGCTGTHESSIFPVELIRLNHMVVLPKLFYCSETDFWLL